MKSFALLALLVPLAGAARPARACIPPPCSPASTVPSGPAPVPANLPALGFTQAQVGGNFVGDPGAVQLLDPDGKAVGLTVEPTQPGSGSYYLRPREPLQPGRSYRLRYPEGCPNYQPKTPPEVVERVIMTGPSTPLPTALGHVTVTGHRVDNAQVGAFIGACVLSDLRVGLTHVVIQPSPELGAYLPLGAITASVNGASAPMYRYEQAGPAGPVEFDIYAHCAGDAGMSAGLMPGKYQVQFGARLFGVTPLPPPVTVAVELSCDEEPSPPEATPSDAGVPSDGARLSPDATPPVDAGPAADAMPAVDVTATLGAATPSCWCTMGRAGRAGLAPLLLPLAALALRGWRRRRSAR